MKTDQTKYPSLFLLFLLLCVACATKQEENLPEQQYLTQQIPEKTPIPFFPAGQLEGAITHQGVFTPGLENYYFTLSDPDFSQFNVMQVSKEDNQWSEPKEAFFNTTFNEHGLSFSADGKTLFFSSTRPVSGKAISDTWHLWKAVKDDGQWGEPFPVNIPNLGGKLVSHPSIAADGTLYFHSSNLDYSEMGIYVAKPSGAGGYLPAQKLQLEGIGNQQTCTPYIDPAERFILFALIGEQLDLAVSKRTASGKWGQLQRLPLSINTHGQGNPHITPDGQFLLYAVGDYYKGEGYIKWVSLAFAFEGLGL